ncbi:hypothetical protein Pla108_41740 [Botrimarina colliarenosi]|uniref:Uncharacterized protein n=1 Tax=Botrimarina colliarenosi TaxID=2528001 RepID=A0A5C5ZXE2_9BACT|nr:hypothetical protein [Botrimarina colliarenosi]TWT91796.1 hypothetical protein Pla108_41740 [Botrimarina colliarenosi]
MRLPTAQTPFTPSFSRWVARRGRRVPLVAFAAAALALAAGSAKAITFDLVYRGPNSGNPHPDALNHFVDTDGSQLIAHVAEAARRWSEIVRDPHTMRIEYYYANEANTPGTTATGPSFESIAFNNGAKNRTTFGAIRVYNQYDLWFDPTPEDDSEYDLSQKVVDDLTFDEEKAGITRGAGVGGVEVGYEGQRAGGAGGDMLRVMMHEIGHMMGITNWLEQGVIEADTDGDWDLRPNLISGRVLALKNDPGQQSMSRFHPELDYTLMGAATANRRKLISQADVLAAANVGLWSDIHFPRKNFLGSNGGSQDFHDGANWVGNRAPEADDQVFIRNGTRAVMTSDLRMESLQVDHNSKLAVFTPLARVTDRLTIGGEGVFGPHDGEVSIGQGAGLYARSVLIESGFVKLDDSTLRETAGGIENYGLIFGHGTVDVSTVLSNHGTLRADNGDLIITGPAIASPMIELSGTAPSRGVIEAFEGNIRIYIHNSSVFRGRMTIRGGYSIDLHSPWQLQPGAELELHGNGAGAATLKGAGVNLRSDVDVTGRARFEAAVNLSNGGQIDLDAGERVEFARATEVNGGRIEGVGRVVTESDFELNVGVIRVAELTLGSTMLVSGGILEAGLIDATGGSTNLDGGRIEFGEYRGKLEQSGGTLVAAESMLDGFLDQTGGEIAFEIASATDFDWLEVSENAVLDGAFRVELAGSYQPTLGELFPVFRSKSFDIESLSLTGPDADQFELVVHEFGVALRASLWGDYNGDGVVDAADYTVWRDGDPAADVDGDGFVDDFDYKVWKENYGLALQPAEFALTVPEPSELLLACLTAAAWRKPRGCQLLGFQRRGETGTMDC